jgi:hypothetical protein
MTAQPEASGFWSGESNSNAAAWLVVEEANPGAFKGRLASFRKIALSPLRLLFEPHAVVRAVLLGKAYAGPFQCLLDADDGGDVAQRSVASFCQNATWSIRILYLMNLLSRMALEVVPVV